MARIVTLQELRANNTKEKAFVLLHRNVYDVTAFSNEHPGGEEVILAEAGKDATEAFEDVGHSGEALALLPGMLVGALESTGEPAAAAAATPASQAPPVAAAAQQSSNVVYFAPLGLIGAWLAYRYLTTGSL
ncbi:cytochrome b5 [Roridomyces roridus]|uniref:Cytochrome b5 n=1 Tax=Roridomyces roridus TaxID=1738132 RepID=A0AAD7FRU7_9AGAR|nr:cytochrome b5 [Roridomyces roridus]